MNRHGVVDKEEKKLNIKGKLKVKKDMVRIWWIIRGKYEVVILRTV